MSIGLKHSTDGASSINLREHDGAELSSNALIHEKKFITEFAKFIADSLETEDKRTITFEEMNDIELMKRLSEYLGSGKVSVDINNATIEAAQAMIAEQHLSEDELAELDNPKSQRAIQARQQKLLEAVREAYKEEAQKRLEEHRAEWDARMHEFGGGRLSGAQITQYYDWFNKKENQDKLRENLRRGGKTDSEINDTFTKIEERRRLWMLMRDGKATDADTRRYNELGTAEVQSAERQIEQEAGANQGNITRENRKLIAGTVNASVTEGARAIANTAESVQVGNGFWSFANDHCKDGLHVKKEFMAASANPDTTMSIPENEPSPLVAITKPKVLAQADTSFSMPGL